MKPFVRGFSKVALLALGILSAGMGLKGFLLSSNFIDGGVTGVSMLLAKVTGLPLALLLPIVNLPFVAVGDRAVVAASPGAYVEELYAPDDRRNRQGPVVA